jgi:hypothetical protein
VGAFFLTPNPPNDGESRWGRSAEDAESEMAVAGSKEKIFWMALMVFTGDVPKDAITGCLSICARISRIRRFHSPADFSIFDCIHYCKWKTIE